MSPAPATLTAERLRKSEIFGDLTDEDLLAIAQFCHEENYQDGDVVLTEDGSAEKLVIVVRGKLALEKKVQLTKQPTPRNATVGYVEPGKVAGFSLLTSPNVYLTSVVCVEPTRAIVIDGNWLRGYLEAHPEAGHKVMTTLASLVADRYRSAINTLTYFLSIVSHELRSPLAAIENYLNTLLGGYAGELTSKQHRMVQRCVLRVSDLRSLIGDVVDLARMRPEQIQADFEWFNPYEVGLESVEDVRLGAIEKGIHRKIEPPPEYQPVVGARRRLRQVFTNLLNNAIKFSPPDSSVYFRAWYEPDEIIFEIEDTGSGIPIEDQPYLFKDFYRATNVGDAPGMGLGLSIANKIIEAHNGKILVKSPVKDGIGSCFTVHIPRNLNTPEMRRQEWSQQEEG